MDVSQAGQVTVPAAQTRLLQLAVGSLYRVTITDTYPGKAEFLLGNQYLLAATPFEFNVGDSITLKLVQRTPELLVFHIALPEGASGQTATDLATLLRAASLPDSADNRAALTQLIRAGIPVTTRTAGEMVQLMNAVPPEALAAFLPLYKELIERNLRPEFGVLKQLALLGEGPPEVAAMLSGALGKLAGARRRGRRNAAQAVEAALTRLDDDDDLPTAALLKQKLKLLYGSPERALALFLDALPAEKEPAESAPASRRARRPDTARGTVEITDLANMLLGEEVPAELVAALNLLEAQRLRSSAAKQTELSLPLILDGEPAEATLTLNVIAEQYYQKDYSLRLRINSRRQGLVEFMIRTRGPGLSVDVLVDEPEVLPYYEEELPRLSRELGEDTGFIVRHAAAQPHSL